MASPFPTLDHVRADFKSFTVTTLETSAVGVDAVVRRDCDTSPMTVQREEAVTQTTPCLTAEEDARRWVLFLSCLSDFFELHS